MASIVWSCCPKLLFCDMHHGFIHDSDMGDCLNLNDNLMAHFNEGKGCEGIRTVKTFELESTRRDVQCGGH